MEALGPAKTAVLPIFHAITGADNAGSILGKGKGKVTCWKEFQEADDSILSALSNVNLEEQSDDGIKGGIERFV